MGRPKGSKNTKKPSRLLELKIPARREPALALSRECLKIVHDRARNSGLSPQMVLEDLIIAGDYTMGPAYDTLTNFRSRIRAKATTRNHVVPVTSTDPAPAANGANQVSEPEPQNVADAEESPDELGGIQERPTRASDANVGAGQRPEDNPAFRDPSLVGDVTGVIGSGLGYQTASWEDKQFPDPGPVLTDEEGNPIEPQEVPEEEMEG